MAKLTELVVRLETLGHKPADIYSSLAKRIEPKLASTIVCDVTGWIAPQADIRSEGSGLSAETRAKISAKMTGREFSLETREKMSAARRGKRLGVKLSAKTRAKISAKMTGREISLETREKMAAARRGKSWTAETRAKMLAVLLGRPCSPETRAKISATLLSRRRALQEGRGSEPDVCSSITGHVKNSPEREVCHGQKAEGGDFESE